MLNTQYLKVAALVLALTTLVFALGFQLGQSMTVAKFHHCLNTVFNQSASLVQTDSLFIPKGQCVKTEWDTTGYYITVEQVDFLYRTAPLRTGNPYSE